MRQHVADPALQPVRALILNPLTRATTVNTSQIGPGQPGPSIDATTARPVGSASITKTRQAGTGTGALGVKSHTETLSLRPGDVFRWGFWVKSSVTMGFLTYWERVYGPAGYMGGQGGPGVTLQANVWTWVTGELTIATDAQATMTTVGLGGYASNAAEGVQVWWNGLRASLNAPLPDVHGDGDTPGWRWTGTAGESLSVGYPYTLESIAGRPAAWYDARYPLGRGVALPADGTPLDRWVDLSGSGRDLAQANVSYRPAWRAQTLNRLGKAEATGSALSATDGIQTFWGAALSVSTDVANPVPGVAQVVKGTAGTNASNQVAFAGSTWGSTRGLPVVTGDRAHVRVKVRHADTVARTCALHMVWWDAAGNTTEASGTVAATIQPNTWTDVAWADAGAIAPSTAVTVGWYIVMNMADATTPAYIGPAQLTRGQAVNPPWTPPTTLPGGQPVVQFDGLDDVLVSGPFDGLDGQITVYTVHYHDALPNVNGRVVRKTRPGYSASGWGLAPSGMNTRARAFYFTDDAISVVAAEGTGLTLNTPILETGKIRVAQGLRYVDAYVYGPKVAGASSPSAYSGVPGGQLSIGADLDRGNAFSGGVATVIAFEGAHDDATRNRVEKWLGSIYGIGVS